MDNLETLKAMYSALVAGDLPTVIGFLSEDVKAHVPGRSQVAGDYDGMEAVVGYVSKLMELSGATLRFETHAILADDDDHGVVLINDRAEREGRAPLDVNNVHLWHVSGEKLREIWVYPGDQYAWDDFWN
ncbi:MAG: nuclear transport factor 2 family protein [Actinomycetota bacterium]